MSYLEPNKSKNFENFSGGGNISSAGFLFSQFWLIDWYIHLRELWAVSSERLSSVESRIKKNFEFLFSSELMSFIILWTSDWFQLFFISFFSVQVFAGFPKQ